MKCLYREALLRVLLGICEDQSFECPYEILMNDQIADCFIGVSDDT